MSRDKIAIIGTGISGLASAWFLHKEHDITVFEQDDRIGGHSNTVMVSEGDLDVPIDTGFMVYNEVTYPLLTRIFKELDVATKPTEMSFSVQHREKNLEFNGGSLNLLFGQRKNLLNLRYWRMLMQINRFNRETVAELASPRHDDMPLCEYVKVRGYGNDFFKWYLTPMAAAVWSSSPDLIEEFPARTLMRFWYNHGFLGLNTQHPWRTVSGGSRCYVQKLIKPFEEKIRRNIEVKRIHQGANGVELEFNNGTLHQFDKVVIATHGDQALRLIEKPTPLENELLQRFQYKECEAILHTDTSCMPKTRRCWAAWNYRMAPTTYGKTSHSTHYWMNELQGVSDKEQYFVSINSRLLPRSESIKKRIKYTHPQFNLPAVAAQNRLHELNIAGQETHRFFCGAWQRYGFHEDGLWSAERMCKEILKKDPW